MKFRNIKWTTIVMLSSLIVILAALYFFINLNYPMIGHDYSGTLPGMLDILIHYRNNGLAIEWYTPSLGGGIPLFPDPNTGQFSILGILPLWMSPWQAVFISSVIYISLGFLASHRFFKKVLNLSAEASILGAIFFSANGFMMERITVGHLGFQPFPLLAVVILLFFDSGLPATVSGILLGVVLAILVHQAGYFVVILSGLSGLIVLPLVYLFRPEMFSWKRIRVTAVLGAIVGLLISAAKLSAVYSYMRFFPRLAEDTYYVNIFSALMGLVLQLLGTMNLVPLFWIAGLDRNFLPGFFINVTGAVYGFWEFDMSMSPVVFAVIFLGLSKLFHAPRRYYRKYLPKKNWIAFFFFIFFTWLAVEFTLATGLFYPSLRNLPILSSLHVNARFASAFLFPIAVLAAICYNSLSRNLRGVHVTRIFTLVSILTLVPMGSYFVFETDLQARNYNIGVSLDIYKAIKSGEKFEVTAISGDQNNTQALQKGTSNLNLYNPIFGYSLETFHPEIHEGSIWEVSDGYFNMTNPSGYVFPEVNGTHPFERIKVDDRARLQAFATHNLPNWELPVYQKVCNWISGLTIVFVMLTLFLYFVWVWQKRSLNQRVFVSQPVSPELP